MTNILGEMRGTSDKKCRKRTLSGLLFAEENAYVDAAYRLASGKNGVHVGFPSAKNKMQNKETGKLLSPTAIWSETSFQVSHHVRQNQMKRARELEADVRRRNQGKNKDPVLHFALDSIS